MDNKQVTAEWIAEQRAICEKATPGPWDSRQKREGTHIWLGTDKKPIVDVCGLYGEESERNVQFIIASRANYCAALDALEASMRREAEKDAEIKRINQSYANALSHMWSRRAEIAHLTAELAEKNAEIDRLKSGTPIDLEAIAEAVHNAWWKEKIKQGGADGHPDAKPYAELPESVKEYDRVTAREVLSAIQPEISRLTAELAAAKRERDAAVKDLRLAVLDDADNTSSCKYCKHQQPDPEKAPYCLANFCNDGEWEWRGPTAANTGAPTGAESEFQNEQR